MNIEIVSTVLSSVRIEKLSSFCDERNICQLSACIGWYNWIELVWFYLEKPFDVSCRRVNRWSHQNFHGAEAPFGLESFKAIVKQPQDFQSFCLVFIN